MPEPLTIADAAGFIRTGALTPSELLEQCLGRIDRYEERVRAWVHIDRAGAREHAARLTAEVQHNNYRGPLHGIPIGIKDIIDVFDMPTGCGSKRWAQSYARRDATCVERLRQAGAVILGKTVTTAYASFDPPVTRNPWNLDRTPGGSSSGSAAAVACGMCLGALATQTGGSITRPASYCGVYSLKPTHGRVSVDGVLPLAPSLDHVGVMANCVRDLAIVFQVIAGHDPRDPTSDTSPVRDCLHAIDGALGKQHGPVFWFMKSLTDELAEAVMRDALGHLSRSVTTVWMSTPTDWRDVLRFQLVLMSVEAAAYHSARLARDPDDYPPRVRELIERGLRTPATEYSAARHAQERSEATMHPQFGSDDVILTPAAVGPAPPAATTGDPVFNAPWSFLGTPTVSVPFAYTADGLPLSAQIAGVAGGDHRVLAAAACLEREAAFERRPLPL
ncbi:MAG TPA: amidase [Gemmata sp.]